MKIKCFITVISILLFVAVWGQRKISPYRFHSINSLSLLNGANEVSAGLQTVNGFQKKNFFLGIGLGLDYYIYRSVPLFADFRYDFGKGKNKFFAYTDGGINFEWAEDHAANPVIIWDGVSNLGTFYNGIYSDAGFGYKTSKKYNAGLVLSLGYSYKSLKKTVCYQDWRTREWLTDIYRYHLSRVVIRVGWSF